MAEKLTPQQYAAVVNREEGCLYPRQRDPVKPKYWWIACCLIWRIPQIQRIWILF